MMQNKDQMNSSAGRVAILLVLAGFLYLMNQEFYQIAWGTGEWLGDFSLKWALGFFSLVVLCVLALVGLGNVLWRPQQFKVLADQAVSMRNRLGAWKWLLSAIVLFIPIWLLQYTPWGVALHGTYIRLMIWSLTVISVAFLISSSDTLVSWPALLIVLVLSAGFLVLAFLLQDVTSYPFSLGWSEGNRLWDYSVLFGQHLYDYPPEQPITVLLDIGRQFIGGIPFLAPGVTIAQVRLWIALTYIIPFLLCGWLAYRLPREKFILSALAGLWAFTFLQQGPIHPPLVLSALLVALAWRRSLWLAIPLIMLASYFAQVSRWHWMFAPGLWAAMLEFSDYSPEGNRLTLRGLKRPVMLGLAGLFAGYYLPFVLSALKNWSAASPVTDTLVVGGITTSTIQGTVSAQALLWYRLFPNATYGSGILAGLLLATVPLAAVLIYLANKDHWKINIWQRLSIVLPLLAFLVVGLIVSVKIGGGGDLHNLDMFIIGMLFAGALAWRRGGAQWLASGSESPAWLRIVLVLLVALPAVKPLMGLHPRHFSDDLEWLAALTDTENTRALGSLASDQVTESSLQTIRTEVENAKATGEVLFMDQRQLLTFGYIRAPLVPEYDKKVLINSAMSADQPYFQQFYRDLADHRFSLIISSRLYRSIKDSTDQFGEENNAWVIWVARPILCYYTEDVLLKEVGVQLLVPKTDPVDCSDLLPLPRELQP